MPVSSLPHPLASPAVWCELGQPQVISQLQSLVWLDRCRAFTPNPTDFVSPGLTHDGTKCGEGRVSY